MTIEESSRGEEWSNLASALGDASRTVLASYAVAITAALIFAALILGAGFPLSWKQAESLGTIELAIILLALLALYTGLIITAFLYAKAFAELRERLYLFPSEAQALLETPVAIMYYSSLSILIGLLLIIIVIGLIPIALGSIGHLIGKILLGYALTRIHSALNTPGILLIASAALSVASILPFLGFLALVSAAADIVAYFMILQWSREHEAQAASGERQA